MATFGTTTSSVPGDQVTVGSGGTIEVSAAFSTTVGLVGGMDTANGSATAGDVVEVESSADAETKFGAGSELKAQVDLAFNNGASIVYAVGVSETQTTESFATVSSGTLANAPAMDPNVQEEDITAQDTTDGVAATVNIVYDSPPATPADADTINLNPATGEWEADSSSSYDITYVYGDYSTAIQSLVKKVPRSVTALTENTSVANDLLTELGTYADNFDFMHGYVGALPDTNPDTYSDSFDDRRLAVVSPSRAYTDEANTEEVRTLGAVGGKQASKPLGDSTATESLAGLVDLRQKYTNSEAGTLIDNQVLPLQQGSSIYITKDMTTSTDPKFERIAWSEVTDEATELVHEIAQPFISEAQTDTNRLQLGQSIDNTYSEMEEDDLLSAYAVEVSEGAASNETDVDIGLQLVEFMDRINIDITVGDVVLNGGAS